jgi:tripartite-type tricarboxylate transporter receptor subunit TctC
MRRRKFLQIAIGMTSAAALPRLAAAEAYPSRPVHLVVQVPPGGSPDIVARLIGQWLSERLGQSFIIDNRTGASGNIATEFVAKSLPDGYTLLSAQSNNAINASLFPNLNYNFLRDIAPVAGIGRIPLVVEVTPSFPAQTLPEFIAYLKANPGKVTMASGGTGTPAHVAEELFCMMADVKMTHVSYRGEGQALPDVMSGQIQVIFGVMPASLGYIRAGKLRALGVTSAARQLALPDIPPVGEVLPGYEAAGWYGVAAPNGTPQDIVAKLNTEINAALADPTVKARLTDLGVDLFPGSPDDFTKFITAETEKWAKVVKFAGIQPE